MIGLVPPERYATAEFFIQVIKGEKSLLYLNRLNRDAVPLSPRKLSVDKMLKDNENNKLIKRHLPDNRNACVRDFVVLVINTLDPYYFPSVAAKIAQEELGLTAENVKFIDVEIGIYAMLKGIN